MPEAQGRARAPRGMTWEPWPCCGAGEGGEEPGRGPKRPRPKSEVICPECRRLIETGRRAEERQAEAGKQSWGWAEDEMGWPRYIGGPEAGQETETALRKLSSAFFGLVSRLVEFVPDSEYKPAAREPARRLLRYEAHESWWWSWPIEVRAEPALREALDAVDAGIRTALEEVREDAFRAGRNTLLALAEGKTALDDFESHTLKRKRRGR